MQNIEPSRVSLSSLPGAGSHSDRFRLAGVVAMGMALVALSACGTQPSLDAAQPQTQPRAILVSFDALNEQRLRESLDPAYVPNLLQLFETGSCAEHAISAFPTLTAPSHATLWTGAYGEVTGVKANAQPALPRDRHSLLDSVSGFSAEVLAAEPLWITAGRQGLSVVGHHVTQAPAAPAYPPEDGAHDQAARARIQEARRVLELPQVRVLNGYNRMVSPHRVLTAAVTEPRPARDWQNLQHLGPLGVAPREIAWEVEGDSVFALFYGEAEYDRVLIAPLRDAARGVNARPAAAETAPSAERPLARHFSDALELAVDGGSVFLRARLFELAPDASTFLLYIPALHVSDANRPDVRESYERAVQGWVGNSALNQLTRGEFGPTLLDDGDGTAEARYLETVEYVTRQFMRGVEWAWNEMGAQLLLDYFPVADAVDHRFFGYLDSGWPEYDAASAAKVQQLRQAAWALVDRRFAHLRQLVAADPRAILFVSGDHGMRATWQVFRPNVALREAGLLSLGSDGRIDLSRTYALSPNGYWINLNRKARKGGIVPPEREAEVLRAVERALRAVQMSDGGPAVTALYRPDEHPGLGLGGAAGGDLYYGTASGIRWSAGLNGRVLSGARIDAGHGFPSTDPDMWTIFCAWGRDLRPGRIPAVRTTAVAPTVAEWLGIEPPRDATGNSVWSRLRAAELLAR